VEKDDNCCWHVRQTDGRNDEARPKPDAGLKAAPTKVLRLFIIDLGNVRYAQTIVFGGVEYLLRLSMPCGSLWSELFYYLNAKAACQG